MQSEPYEHLKVFGQEDEKKSTDSNGARGKWGVTGNPKHIQENEVRSTETMVRYKSGRSDRGMGMGEGGKG